jgi:AraC-like DNA-binding protein
MDQLAPLLSQVSLSARVFFAGELCQTASFDDSELVGHLHLVKAGRVAVIMQGTEVALIERPSVLLIPRPCDHSLAPKDPEGFELMCASLDLGFKVRSPLAMALPKLLVVPFEGAGTLEPALRILFEEAFGAGYGRQAALDRLTEYFLILILRHITTTGGLKEGIFAALSDQRLSRAVLAMHDRPAHPWGLDELASLAGMSRARFAVNFRETVGVTPLEYLTDWRLSLAQTMIRQGRSLKGVASEVGYQSQAAFTRVFTRKIGCSPTDWERG